MGFLGKLFFKGEKKENSISAHDTLMKSVENVMRTNFKGQGSSLADKILRIWVDDSLRYESLKSSDFVESLRYHLDSQMGLTFAVAVRWSAT